MYVLYVVFQGSDYHMFKLQHRLAMIIFAFLIFATNVSCLPKEFILCVLFCCLIVHDALYGLQTYTFLADSIYDDTDC